MSKKQTAVEWLVENIKSHFEHDGDLLETFMISANMAIDKERKQMIEFAKYCFKYTDYITSCEDLYTQTYGKSTPQS